MMRVAERDRLFAGIALAGGITRIGTEFEERSTHQSKGDHREDDARTRK